jgi:ubiquinone/menaquinone biosynthesis C-methylase UbiE
MTSNSVTENLHMWDQAHSWDEDGDEWKGQAIACGVPYPEWKQSLIDHLITPYIPPGGAVLEIAPGHGRWSGHLADRAGRLVLVDLSPTCLEHCQRRFAERTNIEYRQGDGSSLPADLTGALDLVWSFDSVVHIAPKDVASYLRHIHRVLKPGGMSVIHHANRFHWTLALAPMRKLGPTATFLYRALSICVQERIDGWRSPISARLFASMAREAGLEVVDQFSRWGDGRCGVPRHNDRITVMRKPG